LFEGLESVLVVVVVVVVVAEVTMPPRNARKTRSAGPWW
jgi:hypothetical protein